MSLSQEKLCKSIYLLAAVAGMFLVAFMSFSALTGDLPSRLYSVCVLLLYALIGCSILWFRPIFKSTLNTLCAMVLLFFALCLRLSVFDHISGDYVSFLSVWTESMRHISVKAALTTPIGDYNMPYLYVILVISRLPFYDLYCIKLFSVLADVAAALAIGKLATLFSKKQLPILLAFAAALFAPTTWLNSAYWGQCDSVYGALALWGLYYGLKERPIPSVLLFSFSLAFKLQAIFILPILAFLLVTNRMKLKHILLFPLGFLLAMSPALIAGRSFYDTFSIYFNQANAYPLFSLSAPSFWCLFSSDYFNELPGVPVILAMVLTLLTLFVFLKKYPVMDHTALLELALIFSLLIPWSLPRMHERYFYLAEVLSIVYVVIHPKRLPVAVILLMGGFLAYGCYLFANLPILSLPMLAVLYGIILTYMLVQCYHRLACAEQSLITQGGNTYGN